MNYADESYGSDRAPFSELNGCVSDVVAAFKGTRERQLRESIARARGKCAQHDRNIEKWEIELRRLAELRGVFPREDPFHDGVVLVIQTAHQLGGKVYTYAAIRVAKRWWVTGVGVSGGLSWWRLVEWLLENHVQSVVRLCGDDDHNEDVL